MCAPQASGLITVAGVEALQDPLSPSLAVPGQASPEEQLGPQARPQGSQLPGRINSAPSSCWPGTCFPLLSEPCQLRPSDACASTLTSGQSTFWLCHLQRLTRL